MWYAWLNLPTNDKTWMRTRENLCVAKTRRVIEPVLMLGPPDSVLLPHTGLLQFSSAVRSHVNLRSPVWVGTFVRGFREF